MANKKLEDTIGSLLSDIGIFLEGLSNFKLSKEEKFRKAELLKNVSNIYKEYPHLATKKICSDKISLKSESSETYDDVGNNGIDNKALSSHDSDDNQSLSGSTTSGIRGYLIRKNVSKIKLISILKSFLGRKYCVAIDGVFSIYDTPTTKNAGCTFPLFGYQVRTSCEQESTKEFRFELVCPGQKSYHFAVESEHELDRWVNALKIETLKKIESGSCDDDQLYEDAGDDESSRIRTTDSISLSPDEDLYDDITNQLPQPARPAPPMKPPSSSYESSDEELYDDIAETKPNPVPMTPKAEPARPKVSEPVKRPGPNTKPPPKAPVTVPKATPPVTTPKAPTTSSTPSRPALVSSKDGVPYDKMYYGKWDCTGNADDELSFKHADILTVISQEFDSFGWWVAEFHGTVGLVPRDYLTPAYELIVAG